ncbi:2',5'-phosphodiesterase 12 [Xenopus laevis]|uniref:2',5'-phosphodiesterase 12 n=2 Tax=Xenopus laevis TaxID=8355 RepID=A0A1L8GI43_XENLA|nr:2',5'-phosphodiesterase 12 [Xenopus laevis]OCT83502.1 hypothetical protein XELAEV_18026045mg [Xenopus laevis]
MGTRVRALLGKLLVRAMGEAAGGSGGQEAAINRAVVRAVPEEPKLSISLEVGGSRRNLQREQKEPLGRALARLAASAAKGQGKGKRGRKEAQEERVPVCLSYEGREVPEEEPNGSAWREGSVLSVGSARYLVERNPPAVLELELPRVVLVGAPLCPRLRLEFGRPDTSRFEWSRRKERDWEQVGTGRVFTPGEAELGHGLKVRAVPGDGERWGLAVEAEVEGLVEAGPGHYLCDARLRQTESRAGAGTFRTVSYNILADVYARTELSRDVLYPYCPARALGAQYRHNLLRRELSGYRADVLCLQEAERDVFKGALGPVLEELGMEGRYLEKQRQHEGLATFYSRDRFRLLGQHDISLSEGLLSDPRLSDLRERLSLYREAREKLLKRSSVLQVLVLESIEDPSRRICVANTHLYFHPKGGNIRLLQVAVALAHLGHVANELYGGIPVVFCGDFNSLPDTGLHRFIKGGAVGEDDEDWTSNGEEERCNMALTHPFKLTSACGEPAYTNYIGEFHGCLDYIFIDSARLAVERIIPLPTHQEVTKYRALPSIEHPSDHMALVCDLKWT